MPQKNKILKLMKEEYSRYINGVLNELSVFDSRGELVIGPDLKVVHEPSGLEYTVKSVEGEPGNAKITLRTPDQPRDSAIDPSFLHPDLAGRDVTNPSSHQQYDTSGMKEDDEDDDKEDKTDYGIDAHPHGNEEIDIESDETIFVVDEKEFMKNYKEA